MSHNKKYLCIPLVLLVLAAGYYFCFFLKSPSYAVKEIQQAIAQKDTAKFQEYVDLDSVLDKSFEDMLIAENKITNASILENPFAMSVLHMLKPAVVGLMKEEVLHHIAQDKSEQTRKPADPIADAMRRNMERKAYLQDMTFKGIKLDQEAADKATANVLLRNEKLEKDFALNLSLRKDKEGKWQVKEISNLAAIIMQIDAAEKAKRATENSAVLDRLKRNLSVNDKKLMVTFVKASELAEKVTRDANAAGTNVPTIATNVVNKEIMEPCLTSKLLLKNISNKTIIRAYYDIDVLDKDKKSIYSYPEHFDGIIPANTAVEVIAIKKLNPLLPDDKALATKNDQELDCNITITYIAFEDGTVIEPNQFIQY